jgi:hypothetical protein
MESQTSLKKNAHPSKNNIFKSDTEDFNWSSKNKFNTRTKLESVENNKTGADDFSLANSSFKKLKISQKRSE